MSPNPGSVAPATTVPLVRTEPRPSTGDPLDRLSWTLDPVGREVFKRDDIRDQIRSLMRWPGRVSGWRRASHVWSVDARSGIAYVFGAEGAAPWRQPGVAALDPRSIVCNAQLGAPPSLRTMTLESRRETYIVVSASSDTGFGCVVEMGAAASAPTTTLLAEAFVPPPFVNLDDDPRGGFDSVDVASIYMVTTPGGVETAALLSDSAGNPRAWVAVDHIGQFPGGLEIGPDNATLRTSHGVVDGFPPAAHRDQLRTAVLTAFKAMSAG